ncbi:MAG TPA: PadR family transcriptional regulator [Ktedonobacteraceae bacterium]|nr:PadR family transcriptional regulator [Ktedonobacteraceae bacterium]
MFGRRFGREFQRAWEEGWVPPWLQEGDRGPGGPHGPHGHHGHHGPRERGFGPQRFFGRGDMKFALLSLLQERSMYGYEMIKALEERSGGFYSPSPGSIYPTLQMLEERGFVTSEGVEGKKVYSITAEGRGALSEHQESRGDESFGPPWMRGRFGEHGGRRPPFPEFMALRSEAGDVMRLFMIAARSSINDPARLARLHEVLNSTRKDLSDMIYGTSEQAGAQPKAETPPTATPPTTSPEA